MNSSSDPSAALASKPVSRHRLGRLFNPAVVTLFAMTIMVLMVTASAGWDPLVLARLGTRYSLGDANGTEGYDGQFVYYIARDPRPEAVAGQLDVPAYRYQRILLPLAARFVALGNIAAVPWVLALIGILSQAAGTWAVSVLLDEWGTSRWYALTYGLFAGFTLAVRLDLPEPLAYALVAGALLAGLRGRPTLGSVLYGLALFAKEVTILFVAAQLLAYLFQRRWRDAWVLCALSLLPYALFQAWLWWIFGQPGLGSGGAMATPFEVIPFMGLWRIGFFSPAYLVAMLVVFGPAIVLPVVWGAYQSLRFFFTGERNVIVLGLLLNALVIAFLPFSTFRETGGILRFACGLVLGVLLLAGRYRLRRALNYSVLWVVLNVFLLKS